jgi:tetratricopeptide (TPR) repeat protein
MPNIIYVIAAGGLFNIDLTRKSSRISDRGNDSHTRIARSWESLAAQYRARGRILKDQGRPIEAKIAWQHGLDLLTKLTNAQPRNAAFHQQWCDCANDLAWLLVNTTDLALRDPDRALSLALEATERYPACHIYWNTMAACYYRKGDYRTAMAALDRSVTLGDGGTAFDHVLHTMTQAQLGNQDQAQQSFAETMLLMGQKQLDQPELCRLCDEARLLLNALPETPAVAP